MTGKVVGEYSTASDQPSASAFSVDGLMPNSSLVASTYSPNQVAAAVALMIGIVQVCE